jgi:adenosine deaminase
MKVSMDDLSWETIKALPKVELHVHLDCCLSWRAVSKLLPGTDYQAFQRQFVAPAKCRNLADFLRYIDHSLSLLQTEKGLRIAVEDLFDQFKQDNVIYAEVRFAPLLHQKQGLSPGQVVSIVADAVSGCIVETGIDARIILCALRHFSAAQSIETAELVEKFQLNGVAALDLAADEARFTLANHVLAFAFARQRGLFRTAHAGEARGADSIRETLAELQPTRIGHGVRSIEDAALPEELKNLGIHLEVCPSCNVQIDLFETHAHHPVERLFRAGVSLGINTDSRTLTSINLTDEYARLHQTFAWGVPEFYQCNRQALAAAFLSRSERQTLLERLEAGYKPWLTQEKK